MKRKMYSLFASLLGMAFAINAAAAEVNLGGASVFLGGKLLDKQDWSPAEQQFEGGAKLAFQPLGWPVGFTAAYFSSYGSGNSDSGFGKFRSRTHEVQLGLEKIWPIGYSGRPFAEAGVSLGKAEASLDGSSFSDTGVGGWLGGGFVWVLARHLGLGIESRYSYVPVRVADVHTNGGGLHIGATIGYEW